MPPRARAAVSDANIGTSAGTAKLQLSLDDAPSDSRASGKLGLRGGVPLVDASRTVRIGTEPLLLRAHGARMAPEPLLPSA